jgi:hypothetical protein
MAVGAGVVEIVVVVIGKVEVAVKENKPCRFFKIALCH